MMNTRRLVKWITFLAVFAMACQVSMDTDSWWHLRAGESIIENRQILTADPFSFTRLGEPWLYPGWLVQVPMVLVFNALGPGGLNLWTAVFVTLAFWFVYRAMPGDAFTKAFVIILAAAASAVYWAARPYLVTFLLSAVFISILEDYAHRRIDRLWWLPVLMVVWANSHGGFITGFILWGCYGLGEGVAWLKNGVSLENGKLRFAYSREWFQSGLRGPVGRLLLVGVLMALAVTLNPAGPGMLLYPFKTVGISTLRDFIQEWQSPDFHNIQMQPFLWLILIALGVLGLSRRRLALTDFLLVAIFLYLSMDAARNIALFALVIPPVLTRHLTPILSHLGDRLKLPPAVASVEKIPPLQNALNWGLLAILGLAAAARLALAFPVKVNAETFIQTFPVGAVDYILAEQPPGRMLNSYNWGGYLLWNLRQYPVFVDGRTDLYGDEIIRQWHLVVRGGEGWQEVLDRWDINLILIEKSWPVVDLLEREGWQLLFEDELSVVYGR